MTVQWETPEEKAAKELQNFRETAKVSAFQALAALENAGLLDQVEAMMADSGTSKITKLAFEKAQEFKRNSPTVKAIADQLGLTEEQVDDLFRDAATIEA